jgi:hypothetical protein
MYRSTNTYARRFVAPTLALLMFASSAWSQELPEAKTLSGWIESLKESPRGPFERIAWFCEDGSILPPRPYACRSHGGGIQHGMWNARVVALREGGYAVANVLAELEAQDFVGPDADLETLKQILLERFLIGWDDGWIFRGAFSYRGALQSEDEEAGARRVALAMLEDPGWRAPARFFLLREAIRLLPLVGDEGSAQRVRQLALEIADKDDAFMFLRAKIHSVPDAGDAERVREYARRAGRSGLEGQYEELASDIDTLYSGSGAADSARALAEKLGDAALAEVVAAGADRLTREPTTPERLATGSLLLRQVREGFAEIREPELALAALTTSLALESDVYAAGNTLVTEVADASRAQRLELVRHATDALYGVGLISSRQLVGVEESVARLGRTESPSLGDYREELRYLARAPEWSGRSIEYHFSGAAAHLAVLEPEVGLYSQDRLRGSPLLFYGALIDGLTLDANRSAGIEHELFGEAVGAGLRALNPGIARGVLRSAESGVIESDGIYLLPETVSELSPVAGILTLGEGSSLSHVQLLARNLGIPNVVVGTELLEKVQAKIGSPVVLAVSPGGVVRLVDDAPIWDGILGEESAEPGAGLVIRPDLDKLDLGTSELLSLSELRARDSGRTSGPKGANLGELTHSFGDAVPNGFVIPFGTFRRLLDQPLEPGGPSVFEWMKERYDAIAQAKGSAEERQLVSSFLSRLQTWILKADPGTEFRESLRLKLEQEFGSDGSYGVFVRSDTNVEDLPGFTGAGLNLTLPNLVGYEQILAAIHEVWASPFSERSYGWRQTLMEDPEYVFPAIVIQRALPSEKSGVLVTADVEEGHLGWISAAVSEGVGGAVEGQATESLRINTQNGEVRLLAQATAPERAELAPTGGIIHVPASGADAVLTPDEIAQLVALAQEVPWQFSTLWDESGEPLPADIEFAFLGGRLFLLQIRPFVESGAAKESLYLSGLDRGLRARRFRTVSLAEVPRGLPTVSIGGEQQ